MAQEPVVAPLQALLRARDEMNLGGQRRVLMHKYLRGLTEANMISHKDLSSVL